MDALGRRCSGQGGTRALALVIDAFFDTSILLAGLIQLGPASEFPQKVMDAVAEGAVRKPHTAWHCCLEFYAVSTRLPEEFRLEPEDALRLIQEELIARFQIHQLPNQMRKAFFEFAVRDRVVGGRIYDSHIAEIARAAKVDLVVTENQRDFVSLLRHGLRVLTAAEFLDELR